MIHSAEQQAFENFGDKWTEMKVIEKAIKEGNGVSFLHHQAAAQMHTSALELKEVILQGHVSNDVPTTRQEANRQLIELLRAEVERQPEVRFGQLLSNLQIVQKGKDPFYEESLTTIMRVMKRETSEEVKPTAQATTEIGVPIYHMAIDGACSENTGDGGWAAVLKEISKEEPNTTCFSGSAKQTTNQRMELTALLEGLQQTPTGCVMLITTSSKYLQQGIQKWLKKTNGWHGADDTPADNLDLCKQINALLTKRNISFQLISKHAEHPENELAHQLALKARNQ